MDRIPAWKWIVAAACAAVSAVAVINGVSLAPDLGESTRFIVRGKTSQDATGPDMPDDAWARSAVSVMRRRMESLKLPGVVVGPAGGRSVAVHVPDSPPGAVPAAMSMLDAQGKLQYRMVHKENEALVAALWSNRAAPVGYAIQFTDDGKAHSTNRYIRLPGAETNENIGLMTAEIEVPDKSELMLLETGDAGHITATPFFVRKEAELWEDHIQSAMASALTGENEFIVKLRFNKDGTLRLRNITREYAPKKAKDAVSFRSFGIVVDGKLTAITPIERIILGGKGAIPGLATMKEARRLAAIAGSGPMPSEATVERAGRADPLIGTARAMRVKASFLAALCLAAVLFLVVYRLQGLVVGVAILAHLVLAPAGLVVSFGFLGVFAGESGLRGTFMLPPIDLPVVMGVMLSVWLAADFITRGFERFFDETGTGKPVKIAADAALDKLRAFIAEPFGLVMFTGVALCAVGGGFARKFGAGLVGGLLAAMPVLLIGFKYLLLRSMSVAGRKPAPGFRGLDGGLIGKARNACIVISCVAAGGGLVAMAIPGYEISAFLPGRETWMFAKALFVSALLISVYLVIRHGTRFMAGIMASLLHDVAIGAGLCCVLSDTIGIAEMSAVALVAVYSIWGSSATARAYLDAIKDPEARRTGDIRGAMDRSLGKSAGKSLFGWILIILLPVLVLSSVGTGIAGGWALVIAGGATASAASRLFVMPAILLFRGKKSAEKK